jgi:hypothetical protein
MERRKYAKAEFCSVPLLFIYFGYRFFWALAKPLCELFGTLVRADALSPIPQANS